jgi:PKD repeat protein
MLSARAATRRAASAATVAATVLAGFVVALAGAGAAGADPAAVQQPPSTNVTADALPTVQVDGVVWTQATSGNTVYAGGSFTEARPAGASAGVDETVRNNLLSYNITTGVLNTAFAPDLNAQVKALAVSPDGTRLYVGGSFTMANGVNRYRLAAYNTSTGALITSFAPTLDYNVDAIVATNSTVYVGGEFSKNGSVARCRLAAFDAGTGALLGWAPTADSTVNAMVLAPVGNKLIVGGSFQQINGAAAYGLAAIDMTTGALLPWQATTVVQDAGPASAILSLSTDGTAIYGTGYVYGTGGNLEGAFSANANTGAINWLEDCHGDTYSNVPINGTLYTVGHAHFCGDVGGFPQTDPTWQLHHALAFTTSAKGTLAHDPYSDYADFYGEPSPALLNWFPDLAIGTVTGQAQAAWSATGNSQYLSLGGEFPSVNGTPQAGLVRFAIHAIAPDKQPPMVAPVPSLAAVSATSVRVSWPSSWDRDNQNLTYTVYRSDRYPKPIYQTTATSQFWNTPTLGFFDTTVKPYTTYQYWIRVTDPDGNGGPGNNVSITTPASGSGITLNAYDEAVVAAGASDYWRLDDQPGSHTGQDAVGFNDLVEGTGVTQGAAGAISGSADAAASFDGTANGTAGASTAIAAPNTFTEQAWFKTTSTTGGNILGFGSSQSGNSPSSDRQLYLSRSGQVSFGVWSGAQRIVTSKDAYNDGQWHQVVASMSSAGVAVYVDGQPAGSDVATTSGDPYSGYWRVGGETPWDGAADFTGDIDNVAVYPSALTQTQIQGIYGDSGRTPDDPAAVDLAPTAAFTATPSGLTVAFDGSASTDSDGTIAGYSWNFGDGTSGTGQTVSHTYATGSTYQATLTVTDNSQAVSAPAAKSVTVSAAPVLIASDAFARTVSAGWGTADQGGAYQAAVASGLSVSGGLATAVMAAAGSGPGGILTSVSQQNVNIVVDTSVGRIANGSGSMAILLARHANGGDYRLKERFLADGTIHLAISRVVAGAETTIQEVAVPAVTYTPGTQLRVRFQVSGSGITTLAGKVWAVGSAEPATPQLQLTDTTAALQAPGAVGLLAYLSGSATDAPVTASFDNLSVTAG